MKILVTGAAGFIGSRLAIRLAGLGHDVTGVDNFSEYYPLPLKQLNSAAANEAGAVILKGDLCDKIFLTTLPTHFDYIFHLAAHPGVSATSSFEDYFSNNVVATKNLLQYAVTCTALKMFVNISTSSVYGIDATKDETALPMPVSDYGVSKLAAEQLVLAEGRSNVFPACSLRLYSVYGPGERPDKLYTRLLQAGLFDQPFYLFQGSEKHLRSFTYVDDICAGIISVMGQEQAVNGAIINIGNDVQYSTKEGIETVEAIIGKKVRILIVPPRRGDQAATKAVIGKARLLLNYQPVTTLEEGLREQAAWFRKMTGER